MECYGEYDANRENAPTVDHYFAPEGENPLGLLPVPSAPFFG
jgi:hypothetical protein